MRRQVCPRYSDSFGCPGPQGILEFGFAEVLTRAFRSQTFRSKKRDHIWSCFLVPALVGHNKKYELGGRFSVQFFAPNLVQKVVPKSGLGILDSVANCQDLSEVPQQSWFLQAKSFWHWRDFLAHRAEQAGKEALFVNLDETSVSRASPDAKGLIVSKRWWPGNSRPCQKICRKDRRSMVTHVGMCTHRTDVQPLLPQVFIGNYYCFPLALMTAIAGMLTGRVQFWRRTSSWNTAALMLEILAELSAAPAGRPEFQIILVLDSASIHLTLAVIRKATELGIWLLVVPPRTTYALQPLDTHVFAAYKAFLRRAYRDAKDEHGQVSNIAWVRTLVAVATVFLNGSSWENAFRQVGLLGDRRTARLDRELRELPSRLLAPSTTIPSVPMLRMLWPSNRILPYVQLLNAALGRRVRLRIS